MLYGRLATRRLSVALQRQHQRLQRRLGYTLSSSSRPMRQRTTDTRPRSSAEGGSSVFSNRLVQEASPYLLQHAHNPVEWYPWGEEAFAKARSEMKPIFLSVGYSTCHWCHVMERESFEDADTAKVLNQDFIAVKVDREERPDVDRVYMSYVQATTGHGGWPMSVFLTPDLKPFFGGTYFPKTENYGMPSFKSLLSTIASTWKEKQQLVLDQSEDTMQELKKYLVKKKAAPTDSDSGRLIDGFLKGCSESLEKTFDRAYGGFGNAPKFPRPAELHALLAQSIRIREQDSARADEMIEMVKWTLLKMSNGGIYDHVGGGFHRYSVDELWHIPHFEKMLYDNPQLAMIYLRMYQLTKESNWASVACGILDYLKREMTDPLGGIYSAEDADSFNEEEGKKSEGAFYVWKASELSSILEPDAYKTFSTHYGIHENGNCNKSVRSDPHQEFIGKNCCYVSEDLEATAAKLDMRSEDVAMSLAESRRKIYQKRCLRPKPHLDNKIVTAWNGMAICAFAQASSILAHHSVKPCFPVDGHSSRTYLEDAKKIAQFIVEYLWDEQDQILRRSYCEGVSSVQGFADDYAWTIAGFLDLYEHSGEIEWLRWAIRLQDRMDEIFFDQEAGGYFSTSGDDPTILLRLKEEYDSAEPAASSIALSNLVRLSSLLTSRSAEWMERAELTVLGLTSKLERMPMAMPQLASSLFLYERYPSLKKVVICGDSHDPQMMELLNAVHRDYTPSKALIFVNLKDTEALQFWKAHSLENLRVLGSVVDWKEADEMPTVPQGDLEPAAYVCANFTCKAPTKDTQTLSQQLSGSASTLEAFDLGALGQKSDL